MLPPVCACVYRFGCLHLLKGPPGPGKEVRNSCRRTKDWAFCHLKQSCMPKPVCDVDRRQAWQHTALVCVCVCVTSASRQHSGPPETDLSIWLVFFHKPFSPSPAAMKRLQAEAQSVCQCLTSGSVSISHSAISATYEFMLYILWLTVCLYKG